MRDGFVDEGSRCRAFDVLNDPGDDMAFAAEGPDDDRLAFLIALSGPLIPMPIAATAADNRFVNLDDPRKLANVLDHRGSDLVAHEPSGLVRAETHIAEDLKGAHSFLRNELRCATRYHSLRGLFVFSKIVLVK
jgi:hypothetical protein